MCSLPDVDHSLAEIRRVLRPGGKFLFIEHVAADDSEAFLRLQQQLLDPLQQLLADGCHVTRNTRAALDRAGFDVSGPDVMSFKLDGFTGPISPHIAGIVTV